jgi:4-amino-4-deoxy-L-arabinose transferase-like glycosyltransferase
MSNGYGRPVVRREVISIATWLIALAILGLVAGIVASRRGNLAWDDADYLRRGLANARLSISAGPLMVIPRAVGCLLHEYPKPPMLVAWIQLGALLADRNHLAGLIIYATVVPYALLLLAVVILGRWLAGVWGGLAALVCMVSSPVSLAFGGKVMVETFLSLWVLLSFAFTCRLLAQPSRRRGAALGIVVGLALLTKLTTVLFVPIPLAFTLVRVVRGPDRRILLRSLAWSALFCAAIAGPWYGFNASKAVKFARFSSQYNQVAEGRPDSVALGRRVALIAADLPGWPLAGLLACAALVAAACKQSGRPHGETGSPVTKPIDLQSQFSAMSWLGAGTAATILLCPSYFDTRFLLPIWPVLAVDLGRRLSAALPRFPRTPRVLLGGGLAACVMTAAFMIAQTPTITTYWRTTALIEDLVREYGISTLGNVGNCAEWNVCKSGLLNELREQPDNCFVLHDLSKLTADDALRHLGQFDAVVVLGQSHLPESEVRRAPKINQAYGPIASVLANDPRFLRVNAPISAGLPDLSVYIRQRSRDRTEQLSRKSPRKRRI